MPIFFQKQIDHHTKLAIWKIEEEEGFFLQHVPLQQWITHPHKRLQHLAGRYLLRYSFDDFPVELIQIADTRKPYLEDEAYHFSISHCGDYAGVIVSKTKRVGIDIELFSDKVQKIRHKFLSLAEEEMMDAYFASSDVFAQPSLRFLILMWSCKEAIFKWYGWGNVDFKEHMQAASIAQRDGPHFTTTFLFKKDGEQLLPLHSLFFETLCLSYIVH